MKVRKSALMCSFGLLFAACSSTSTNATNPKWERIFDGSTLNGWVPKIAGEKLGVDPRQLFRIEDRTLVVNYQPEIAFNGEFGHLFFDEPLSNYRLRLDYRFFGEQVEGGPAWAFSNSGIMVHSQPPETMRIDQAFPISIEAQFLGARSDESDRTTGNICTPGTHVTIDAEQVTQHCVNSTIRARRIGAWVAFEIEVRGGELTRIFIEGEEAFKFSSPTYDAADEDVISLGLSGPIETGYFALQAESHPVAFRNIEIMRLNQPKDRE